MGSVGLMWLPKPDGPGWYWLACPAHPISGQALSEPLVEMAHVLDPYAMHEHLREGVEPTVVDLHHATGSYTPWLIENLPAACRWQKIPKPHY